MKIQTVHEYRRLARRGFVPPLTHSCGEEYTVRLGAGDDPEFHCFACGTTTQLGLADEKSMTARIEDYKAKRNL